MEFDKSKVYTAVNADELKPGDKVIVADDMLTLKAKVSEGFNWYVVAITSILGEEWYGRFDIDKHNFPLAYLVECKENCTTCKFKNSTQYCRCKLSVNYRCKDYEPVETKTTEKHLRPFEDADELIKVWKEKIEADTVCDECEYYLSKLEMPSIWVRYKMNQCGQMGILITKYEKNYVQIEGDMIAMHALMADYEFLDGSPCGVEE